MNENEKFPTDWCIGDIHGEYDKLSELLRFIPFNARLIFIGDYIDKGKRGREIIDFLLDLEKQRDCIFLRGNHELKIIQAADGNLYAAEFLRNYGFKETLQSYGFLKDLDDVKKYGEYINSFPRSHLDFIHRTIMFYMHPDNVHLIVHAGVDPEFPDTRPLTEHDPEKMVFIRNKFLSHPRTYRDKTVIFGHTAAPYPIVGSKRIGIDTGACYTDMGKLTAYGLQDKKFMDHTGEITPLERISELPRLPDKINVFNGLPY